METDPLMNEPMFGERHRQKLERMVTDLTGMDIVLASEFGEKAEMELMAKGIRPYRHEGKVEDAIRCAVADLFHIRANTFE